MMSAFMPVRPTILKTYSCSERTSDSSTSRPPASDADRTCSLFSDMLVVDKLFCY